jgi:hypothetical protein
MNTARSSEISIMTQIKGINCHQFQAWYHNFCCGAKVDTRLICKSCLQVDKYYDNVTGIQYNSVYDGSGSTFIPFSAENYVFS